eukprot:7388821-Prymnesium_polylepis.1
MRDAPCSGVAPTTTSQGIPTAAKPRARRRLPRSLSRQAELSTIAAPDCVSALLSRRSNSMSSA